MRFAKKIKKRRRDVVFMDFKKNLVTQKFRFDLGVSFLTIVNLSLLSITASDKLQSFFEFFGVEIDLYSVIGLIMFLALFGTWAFGYVLDKRFKYWQEMRTIQNHRDPQITDILFKINRIERMMENERRY